MAHPSSSSSFDSSPTLHLRKEPAPAPVAPPSSSELLSAERRDDVDEGGPLGVAPPGFCIDTEAKAEWALDLIFISEGGVARRREQLAVLERRHEQLVAWLEPALADYYDGHLPKRGKTLHLGNGDLGRRLVGGGLHIDNPDALKAWAEAELPAAIVSSFDTALDREVARREIQKRFDAALAAGFAEAPAVGPKYDDDDNDAAFEFAKAKARASLPPGTSMRETENRFFIKAPSAPKGK